MALLIPSIILTILILINQNEAATSNCTYYQELVMGLTYNIYNTNYPNKYTPGTLCVWHIRTVQGTKIYLSCDLDMPLTLRCNQDRLAISPSGDPDFHDEEDHCGQKSFSLISKQTALTVGLSSTRSSRGGKFLCTVTAIRDNTTSQALDSGQIAQQQQQGCTCGWRQMRRIVNGNETGINEYPAMAAIVVNRNEIGCGATIISNRFLLTAAHCIYNQTRNNLLILVGDHDVTTGSETSASAIYTVNAYEIHPLYNHATFTNDIAIIQTTNYIKFSSSVGPICLPFKYMYNTFNGQPVIVLGWGETVFSGPVSPYLKQASLIVTPNSECSAALNEAIPSSKLCTIGNNQDTCQGDSGGPVLWTDTTIQRMYLIGIISNGIGCNTGYPGKDTRVSSYLDWIIDRTGSETSYCSI